MPLQNKINTACAAFVVWLPARAEPEKLLPPVPTLAAALLCRDLNLMQGDTLPVKMRDAGVGLCAGTLKHTSSERCQSRWRCDGGWFPIICLILSMSCGYHANFTKKYDSKNSSRYILLICTRL